MQTLRTDQYGSIMSPPGALEGLLGKVKNVYNKLTRDSVTESDFVTEALATEATGKGTDNPGAIAGSVVRELLTSPLRNLGEAVDKGMRGEQLSIKDFLAITGFNLELMTAGVVHQSRLAQLHKLSPNQMSSFPAWHGGPHGFKKFEDKAIGSGEGAQVFGRGHYLTDSRGIAKSYADKLGGTKRYYYGDTELTDSLVTLYSDPDQWVKLRVAQKIDEDGLLSPEDAKIELVDFLENSLERQKEGYRFSGLPIETWEKRLEAAKSIDPFQANVRMGDKNLYQATVHKGKDPSEYSYLDWHKPLKEQDPDVLEKLERSAFYDELYYDADKMGGFELDVKYKGRDVEDSILQLDNLDDWKEKRTPYDWFKRSIVAEMKEGQSFEDAFNTVEFELDTFFDNDKVTEFLPKIKALKKEDFTVEPRITGEDLYRYMSTTSDEGDEAATKILKDLGISGVKYDAGTISGGVKPGTKNYVVFDPEDITIEQHYVNDKLQP